MNAEQLAQTFTAYLLGPLASENRESSYGPFKTPDSDERWQLDPSNDYWLNVAGREATVSCRYNGEMPTIEAMVALFKARTARHI
jgi:hypothetical protein